MLVKCTLCDAKTIVIPIANGYKLNHQQPLIAVCPVVKDRLRAKGKIEGKDMECPDLLRAVSLTRANAQRRP